MGHARTKAVALLGVRGVPVDVEAQLTSGPARFTLIGLPDAVLGEAKDRVRAAVHNSGESWPLGRLTVGLSPAWVRKHGSAFDLAIAAAILAARSASALPRTRLAGLMLFGELALDGRLRPVRGVLPAVLTAMAAGCQEVVVPEANAVEGRQVPDIDVIGLRSLRQLVELLRGEALSEDEPVPVEPVPPDADLDGSDRQVPDLLDVVGQYEARRALEVSATGGHHILFCGAAGAGKTMLAERLPGLLPRLDRAASLEVSSIHSIAGTLPSNGALVTVPPFCAIHHTATVQAVVGGGSRVIRPGAVSRAHRGVLFLDELPEFRRAVLESLREPLESGEVVIARSSVVARLPAKVLLVAAANPCPCGRGDKACKCPPIARRGYLGKLSGPLLDRIDLRVDVHPVGVAQLTAREPHGESTEVVADRVREARNRAEQRLAGTPWRCNADVPGRMLRSVWRVDSDALHTAHRAVEVGTLSARGLDRVLRIAWTLADLAGRDRPGRLDVDTALGFRLGSAASVSAA